MTTIDQDEFHRLKNEHSEEIGGSGLENLVHRLVGELENDNHPTFTTYEARALAIAYELDDRVRGR